MMFSLLSKKEALQRVPFFLLMISKTKQSMKRLGTAILCILLPVLAYTQVVDPEPGRLTADGPYLFYRNDGGSRIVTVDLDGNISETESPAAPASVHVTSHDGKYSFDVPLHNIERQPWAMEAREKTCIISDPHGRLDCLVSILRACEVIDYELNWCFGENHLVIIGDIMDRGDDVTQILWLVYKLEAEAEAAGGSLSFVYGNHEGMVLAGDLRYCRDKYKELADKLGMEVPELYGPDTELGRWLSTRNTIMKIGADVFVHAGLSADLFRLDMDIPEINKLCSEAIFLTSKEKAEVSEITKMLFKTNGPVWYRGYFSRDEKYGGRMDMATLELILERYDAERVFVGHTIVRNIKELYRGKVVAVDVDAKLNYEAGRGRAVMLEGDRAYVVKDSGKRRRLR